ncbi:two-component regulator propeller domain-containing protein [Bacteroides sp. 51]|uniref:hybrid sensor histidine kinase/response regulator transcription factor n=1 Tax=Bacteroides sp. 51 TaxID=2302938 RepID=UPI0013D7ACF0|nr:two-component regulator propeller domain-containing protein [Bacteroides sp. 51]NDV80408.1 hybrid sensor histidine kinase/response regulator [Bacteroides sp. 51]
MKNIRLILTILIALSCYTPAKGNSSYSFIHINSENGLSQSNVKSIVQDGYGFMWFGTKNGLNRYDGASMITLNCYDPVAKRGNNNISALFVDSRQNLWTGTDEGVYVYNIMQDTFTFIDYETENGNMMHNWVSSITEDKKGNIWIILPQQGVFRIYNNQLFFYQIRSTTETPTCVHVRENGDVWVGTWEAGLFKYNAGTGSFEQYKTDRNGKSIAELYINTLSDDGEWLIMGIQDGYIMKYNPQTNSLVNLEYANLRHTYVRNALYARGEIWAGTHDGLYIIDEKDKSVKHLKDDIANPAGISDNIIYTSYLDKSGGVWLGTMFEGINYLPNRELTFERYAPGYSLNSLSSKRVSELAETGDGTIWIGTEDGGLNKLNPQTDVITRIAPPKGMSQSHTPILSLVAHKDKLYCGLFKQGLNVFNQNGSVTHYPYLDMQINEGSTFAFCIDKDENKWLGTGSGLFKADKNSFNFSRMDQTGHDWIYDIFEDNSGTLWMATMGNGVWKHNPATGSFEKYLHEPDKENTLGSNSVSSTMQDSRGNIWVSTDRGGICRYNPDENNFTNFSIKEGLPDDVAYKILEDNHHYLWFGTNKGLVKFHPDTHEIVVYTTKDGLPGNQFLYKAALKASDGKLYFGGVNGLIAFDPLTSGKSEKHSTPIYISKLSIYNNEVTVHTPDSPLKRNIIGTKDIVLPYDQSNISLEVSLFNYSSTKSNIYYYRLEPTDKEWVKSSDNQNISYANLPPGNYTLHIQSDPEETDESAKCSLTITILPPWWLSTWAYLAYTILLIGLVLFIFLWYKRRKEKQMEERQTLFEVQKEKELYESKVEFFTEIAHEIRTPLTLINGPLESIRTIEIEDPRLNKNLGVIAQNTKRLLNLASQLLDFQRIDSKKLKLNFEKTEIVELIREITERFEPTIQLNQKRLFIDIPERKVTVLIDKEAVTKIISNLLTNALKYSNQNIHLKLNLTATSFSVRVTSDGKKIPAEFSELIFDPFYRMERTAQETQGIGIGLSLSRSLALLHHGKLYLDIQDERNAFELVIPISKEEMQEESNTATTSDDDERFTEELMDTTESGKYSILFVEDNADMVDFMTDRLEEDFQVQTARNGEEALEIARSTYIDLIISDIMMPVMDGWELCRIMKSDIDLCHIPIIFLTAKNDLQSKINGLKLGAEAFVEKPFSYDHLRVQILSLLDNRQKEREAFTKKPFFPVRNMQLNKADEEFMNQVIEVIEENITYENFNVERLAEILCMSRSGMLRKIKMLFNLSPVDFIRVVRLKKAAELIQTGKYRLSEICYMVGVSSPSYFSKLFHKQFGMSPKDFEKQSQQNKEKVNMDEFLNLP